MNYQRIYGQIVDRAKTRVLEKEIYREKHHIIPKCLGGSDDKENLVELTAREHFLCHWLLARIYPNNSKIRYAFWIMCGGGNSRQNRYSPSSRQYEEARENLSHTVETRDRMSKSRMGRKHSELTKSRQSKARLNTIHSKETREKISNSKLGSKHSKTRNKQYRESSSVRMKEIAKNRKRLICQICLISVDSSNFSRHENSCKQKQIII